MGARDETIGVGVIGLGFMGRTHLAACQAARRDGYPCRLVAVCDPKAEKRAGLLGGVAGNIGGGAKEERAFDPVEVRGYEDARALLADADVRLVSICTYTDTHADLAIAAIEAGKDVLVEKPLGLRAETVERIAKAAAGAQGRVIVPAMCMRFWPGWSWVRERIVEGTHGKVLSATFHRLATPPGWSVEFYRDAARSGGAIVDLHIHDTDFVRWCFGEPESVDSTGTSDHVTTFYRYAKGRGPAHVVAEGGWTHSPGFRFRMRYVVVFEKATAEFDLSHEPVLVLSRGGKSERVALPAGSGYDYEFRHVVDLIAGRAKAAVATIEDAVGTAKLIDAEIESVRRGEAVRL